MAVRIEERQTADRKTPIKVKKLGHLVYEVSDVARTRAFWTDVMGFTVSDVNEKGMVFLRTNADHHAIGLKQGKAQRRPSPADGLMIEHLAMEVEDLDALFQARAYLTGLGIPIVFEGRKGAGCGYSVYFNDPDGYQFEIYCDIDQIGEDGRTRPPEQFRPAKSLEEAAAHPLPERW